MFFLFISCSHCSLVEIKFSYFSSSLFFFFSISWNIANNHILSILTLFPVRFSQFEIGEESNSKSTRLFMVQRYLQGAYEQEILTIKTRRCSLYFHTHIHTFFLLSCYVRLFHTFDYLKSFLAACHTKVSMNFARSEFLWRVHVVLSHLEKI